MYHKLVYLTLYFTIYSTLFANGSFVAVSYCTNCTGVNVACVDGVCLPRCLNVTSSGECLQCLDSSFYGKQCENVCPDTCLNSRCQLINSRVVCTDGCVAGRKGDNCGVDCPSTCRDGCDKDTGQCSSCMTCYKGRYCNVTTSECDAKELVVVIAVVITLLISILLLGVFLWNRWVYDHALKCVNYCEELLSEESELNVDFTAFEFSKLSPPDSNLAKRGALEQYSGKNRYGDVLPYDETRVVLQTGDWEESDYINASYINGYWNKTRYVAAQGPNLSTIDDFWRMIWQLNTTKIVMLTNLVEAGKVMCEMYWPFCSSEYECYGEVCVQCMEEKVYQYYTLRTLAVWKGESNIRTVRHFHYTAWPVHGVPEDAKSVTDFHRVVKDTGLMVGPMVGPMVVVSSAGVGRSGAFLALDYLLDQARYEGSVCIFKCLQEFRLQRMNMISTKEQYKFVYDMLANALQYGETLPRNYKTVLLQCEMCKEYQPLWNSALIDWTTEVDDAV